MDQLSAEASANGFCQMPRWTRSWLMKVNRIALDSAEAPTDHTGHRKIWPAPMVAGLRVIIDFFRENDDLS